MPLLPEFWDDPPPAPEVQVPSWFLEAITRQVNQLNAELSRRTQEYTLDGRPLTGIKVLTPAEVQAAFGGRTK